jgi:hypothetical protein
VTISGIVPRIWMRLPGRPGRAVLKVPPLVVVDAVEPVPPAVLFEPPRALGRPNVEGEPPHVPGLLRWQHSAPRRGHRACAPHLLGEDPVLFCRVAVSRGEADQLPVAPERLGPRAHERRQRIRCQPAEILTGETQAQRPLAGQEASAARCPAEGDRHQQYRDEQGNGREDARLDRQGWMRHNSPPEGQAVRKAAAGESPGDAGGHQADDRCTRDRPRDKPDPVRTPGWR